MSPLQKIATPFQSLEAVSALAFASHWIEAVPGSDQLAALHCPSPTFTEKHRDFPVRLGGITAFWGRISAGKGGGTSNCLGDLCTWNDAPQVFKKKTKQGKIYSANASMKQMWVTGCTPVLSNCGTSDF